MKRLIAFAIDDNYAEPFCVAAASFFRHHTSDRYAFALLHENLSADNRRRLTDFFVAAGFDLLLMQVEDVFKDIPVGHHFNSVIFYRLLIPSLFPDHDRVLYLDSDLLFLDSIDDLFDLDMGGATCGAIVRAGLDIPTHMRGRVHRYHASGLLLMDVRRFNDAGILEKALRFLWTESYDMPDQDALNAVIDRWFDIPVRFGVETAMLNPAVIAAESVVAEAVRRPAIIQYSGGSKPWQFKNRHPYKRHYWDHLAMTPYRRRFAADLTVGNVVRWITPKPLRKYLGMAVR